MIKITICVPIDNKQVGYQDYFYRFLRPKNVTKYILFMHFDLKVDGNKLRTLTSRPTQNGNSA